MCGCKIDQNYEPTTFQEPKNAVKSVIIDANGVATILTTKGEKFTQNVRVPFKDKVLANKLKNDSSSKSTVFILPMSLPKNKKEKLGVSSISSEEEGGSYTPTFVATVYYSAGYCNVTLDASSKIGYNSDGALYVKSYCCFSGALLS